MKKLLVFLFALLVVLVVSIPQISAMEVTTTTEETTMTEEVITTTPVTEPAANIIDDLAIDQIAPKLQLYTQILSLVVMAGSIIIALKQRVDVAVAKKRLADSQNELTAEQKLREFAIGQNMVVMRVLSIIVENSKLPTQDKLSVQQLIANNQKEGEDLMSLVSQLTNLDKTDISAILGQIGDLVGLVSGGIHAVKTGDLSKVTSAMDKVGD